MARCLALLTFAFTLSACGSSTAASSSTSGSPNATPGSSRAPSASPSSAKPAKCGPSSARTLASSRVARVYVLRGTVSGCSIKTGKSYELGGLKTCLRVPCVGRVAVAGELVGYARIRHGVDTGSTAVIVRRLTTGKTLREDPATRQPLLPESFQSVDSLVLKSDGAVAWIGEAHSIVGHRVDIEVIRNDRAGQKLLDSGSAIKTGSLRLHRSTLTWRSASTMRSATLR